MILMRMSKHKPKQIAPLRDQECDVRHDQVDAGQFLARERNAEIDRDPFAAGSLADPLEGEVHADLANATERREQELARHQACTRAGLNTSPAVIASSDPPGRRSIRR